MKFPAAIALLAFAVPAFAQHGGMHGGSLGGRGSAGHSGFSGGSGFSHSGSFVRSAPPARFGAPGGARLRGPGLPNFSGRALPRSANRPFPAYGYRTTGPRPGYGSMSASRSRNWSHDRDRDRFAARRRSFANWYANLYPGYAFNLLLDPGFYDWDQTDNFASDQGDAAYAPAPYTDYGSGAPGAVPEEGPQGEIPPASMQGVQRAAAESVASPALLSVQPLTVVFKDGRAPVQMQNYMMTATVLTDLDARHYAQIPVDQIDVAATRQANSAAGVGFAVPGASRD